MFTFVTKITLRHEKMVLMPCSFSCFLFNLFAITALRIKIGTIAEAPLGALGSIMGETLGREAPGKIRGPSHFLSVKSPKSSIY